MRFHRPIAILMIITLVGVAGCTSAAPPDTFPGYAKRAIAAWQNNPLANQWRNSFIPLQGFTIGPPVDAPDTVDGLSLAAEYGLMTLPVPLPSTTPPAGDVVYPDGTKQLVTLESAATTYGHFPPHNALPPCPTTALGSKSCTLTVTQVRLGTATILTSRGMAQVPAWLFSVAQLSAPVMRVAVASGSYVAIASTTVPQLANPQAPLLNTTLTSVAGKDISFTVHTGDNDPTVAPRVYETDTAVIIGGVEPNPPTESDLVGMEKPFTVVLKAPLGTRPLLDALTGQPEMINVQAGGAGMRY